MKRTEMVHVGAQQLFVAEHAIETALSEAAALISSLSRMRLDSKLSMIVGQGAMDAAAEAVSALTAARSAMVRTHGQLNEVKTQIGCGAVAVGTGLEKPEKDAPPSGGGVTSNRVYRQAHANA